MASPQPPRKGGSGGWAPLSVKQEALLRSQSYDPPLSSSWVGLPGQSPAIDTEGSLAKQNGLSSSYSSPNEDLPPSFRPIYPFSSPPGPPSFLSSAQPKAPPPPPLIPSPLGVLASFSDIPFTSPMGKGPQHPLPAPAFDATGPFQPAGLSDELPSSWSAASAFVLFSAHSILKEKVVFNTASLGFGALVCPARDLKSGLPVVRRSGFRCQKCGSYSNLYCSIEPTTGQWKCLFCRKMNGSNGDYKAASKEDLKHCVELITTVVDYIDEGGSNPLGFLPVSETRMAAPLILLIDESLDEPYLRHLQSSLHTFLDCLPGSTRVGIISYGRTVSVYDFSEVGVAAADVLPGSGSPSKELLKMLIYGVGVYLAPLHSCLPAAHCIVSSLRGYRGRLPESTRDRCLGTAVEVALSIIQGPSSVVESPTGNRVKRSGGSSRILICAGGPNTLGSGSIPHSQSHPNYAYEEQKAIKQMSHLGQEARRQEVVVDILCAGTCPVRIPVLHPLAQASGGILALHDNFGDSFGSNLQRAVPRAAGVRATLEARVSDGIAITRVIGPGKEAPADSLDPFQKNASVAVQLLSLEECQSLTLMMELEEDFEEDNAYFQFVVKFTNLNQLVVTRVITVRLPTASTTSSYLHSIDEEVAAVIIGKKIALLAKDASEALNMQVSLDERVKDLALRFGKPMVKTKLRFFPSDLSRLAEILFHLRRGPLLGSIVGHEDERVVLRNLFLNSSFDLSLRMLSPRLLMHREGGTFEELPAYDIAMQSDSVIVLDHGTDVFIWTGSDLAAKEDQSAAALAACRTLAEELTDERFPAPRILAFKEGSSQARYMQARLIPAHKDPPYEQEARFPQLRNLKPDQRAKLKRSFFHTDDLSFCEWMRSLYLIPAEPQ